MAQMSLAQHWRGASITRVGDTLQVALSPGAGLGIDPYCPDDDVYLHWVLVGGMIESWNRMCFSTFPEMAFVPGDEILTVNSESSSKRKIEILGTHSNFTVDILRTGKLLEDTTVADVRLAQLKSVYVRESGGGVHYFSS